MGLPVGKSGGEAFLLYDGHDSEAALDSSSQPAKKKRDKRRKKILAAARFCQKMCIFATKKRRQ